jgi:hypothetical protein
MSNYGPPGDGPAGPWRGRRPDDGYDAPAGPWPGEPGRQTAGSRRPHPGPWEREPGPPYAERYPPAPYQRFGDGLTATGGLPPYPGEPGPSPERRRSRAALIGALAALVLLALAGGAALWHLFGRDDGTPAAAPVPPSAGPLPEDPVASPTAPAPTAPAPESSADPRFVEVGQCVRNEGPAGGRPKLLIAPCAPKTYEVLRRFDGQTSGEKDAEAKCAKVKGYTNWYFFDSQLDTLDFVLCLKLR